MEEQLHTMDLGPIYEPQPVAFAFDTLGWKILFVVLVVFILFMLFRLIRSYIKNAYKREALRLLSNIEYRFSQSQEVECVNDAMILLKQVSLSSYSRDKVADLHGNEWLSFLDSTAKNVNFSKYASVVLSALYKNELTNMEDVNQLFGQSKKWIKHHA